MMLKAGSEERRLSVVVSDMNEILSVVLVKDCVEVIPDFL